MKHVVKTGEPQSFKNWKNLVRATAEEDYRRLQNPEKGEVKDALLKEQGFICAYTMRRIGTESSHIEHIKPESKCRSDIAEGRESVTDLDYSNMLACYPKKSAKKKYKYGAPLKDDWWEMEGRDFISPLDAICENLFRYDKNGNILAVNGDDKATKTIEVLALDHDSLRDDRKSAIQEFLYGPNGASALSSKKTERAIQEILQLRSGKFTPFCVAIKHSLEDHLKFLAKIGAKRKYSKQSRKTR